jgi:hypothetical protein
VDVRRRNVVDQRNQTTRNRVVGRHRAVGEQSKSIWKTIGGRWRSAERGRSRERTQKGAGKKRLSGRRVADVKFTNAPAGLALQEGLIVGNK